MSTSPFIISLSIYFYLFPFSTLLRSPFFIPFCQYLILSSLSPSILSLLPSIFPPFFPSLHSFLHFIPHSYLHCFFPPCFSPSFPCFLRLSFPSLPPFLLPPSLPFLLSYLSSPLLFLLLTFFLLPSFPRPLLFFLLPFLLLCLSILSFFLSSSSSFSPFLCSLIPSMFSPSFHIFSFLSLHLSFTASFLLASLPPSFLPPFFSFLPSFLPGFLIPFLSSFHTSSRPFPRSARDLPSLLSLTHLIFLSLPSLLFYLSTVPPNRTVRLPPPPPFPHTIPHYDPGNYSSLMSVTGRF